MQSASYRPWVLMGLISFLSGVAEASLIKPGDLAFIGFNADGRDDFAIVLLASAEAGTVVRLTDREWQGTSFNTGEGAVSWTLSQTLSAGSVVIFSNIDNASNVGFGASSGTLSGALQFATGGESLYAFIGPNATTPTTFLAAISTESSDFSGATGTLNGTGLTLGTSAVLLPNGTRGGEYTGSRSNQANYFDYLSLIGNTSENWTRSNTNGSIVLPFDTQPFTTTQNFATPEPATWTMAVLAAFGVVSAVRRNRRTALVAQ